MNQEISVIYSLLFLIHLILWMIQMRAAESWAGDDGGGRRGGDNWHGTYNRWRCVRTVIEVWQLDTRHTSTRQQHALTQATAGVGRIPLTHVLSRSLYNACVCVLGVSAEEVCVVVLLAVCSHLPPISSFWSSVCFLLSSHQVQIFSRPRVCRCLRLSPSASQTSFVYLLYLGFHAAAFSEPTISYPVSFIDSLCLPQVFLFYLCRLNTGVDRSFH